MNSWKWSCLARGLASVALASLSITADASTLATATYDTDSYVFIGTNNEFDPGITITEDTSAGALDSNQSHFLFAVVKFDNLSGLSTKANGGGDKFLKLSMNVEVGPATIGVSAAQRDIESDTEGYPSGFFPGNPTGNEINRLEWYMNNVKGDDAAHGGYAGGAKHLGTLDVPGPGKYFLDVTTTIDAWIDGSQPNFGFGLWGASVPGGQGITFDFVSSDNLVGGGPELVSAIPEPSGLALSVFGLALLGVYRRR